MTYTCPHCRVVFSGRTSIPLRCEVCNRFLPKSLSYTANKETSMKTGSFIVGSIHKQTGELSFSKNPAPHATLASAKAEAERLAKTVSEKEFVVVQIKGTVTVSETIWK